MAKSGTSLERETRRRRNITLQNLVISKNGRTRTEDYCRGSLHRGVPKGAVQNPTQSECPTNRGISSYAPPAQDQIKREAFARYQCSE